MQIRVWAHSAGASFIGRQNPCFIVVRPCDGAMHAQRFKIDPRWELKGVSIKLQWTYKIVTGWIELPKESEKWAGDLYACQDDEFTIEILGTRIRAGNIHMRLTHYKEGELPQVILDDKSVTLSYGFQIGSASMGGRLRGLQQIVLENERKVLARLTI